MNRLRKSLLASLTVAGLTYALCVPSALAQPPGPLKSLTESLEEIEAVDGQGLWFSYGIALLGGMFGLGLGGWALYESPLATDGNPDPLVFGSSILVTGTAMAQIIHGGMRLDERAISAKHARILLEDEGSEHCWTSLPSRPCRRGRQYSLLGCGHDNDSGDRHLCVGTSSLDRREWITSDRWCRLHRDGYSQYRHRSGSLLRQAALGADPQPNGWWTCPTADNLFTSGLSTALQTAPRTRLFDLRSLLSCSHNEESRPASEGGAAFLERRSGVYLISVQVTRAAW